MAHATVSGAPVLDARVGRIYDEHYGLLYGMATLRFRIPADDAASVVHDVMLSFVQAGDEVHHAEKWLVGAICNASRHYWRRRRRDDARIEAFERERQPVEGGIDGLVVRITVNEVLGHLHERCRKALILRYAQGYSTRELAQELETTARYAEKMIYKCLQRAREILRGAYGQG